MIKNFFKIAWRYIAHNKIVAIINISGLAFGMATAMLIGLWIYDELTFNQYHTHYRQITQVLRMDTRDGERVASTYQPMPLAAELQTEYGRFFKHIVMTRQIEGHLLTYRDKKFTQQGSFMQKDGPDMLTLKMLSGSREGLSETNSVLLSASVAHKLFGVVNPVGQLLKIDAVMNVMVTGVYEDLPDNSTFKDAAFIAPFDLYIASQDWAKGAANDWSNQFVNVYAELAPDVDVAKVSKQVKNLYSSHMDPAKAAKRKTALFLQPMDQWHLYSKFENGVNVTSDELKFVWFYSLIGGMVLLMGCINFMNLSTARSQKRAREVGVRKVIGSSRRHLIFQFFGESLLVASIAFCFSVLLVLLALPWFNTVAGKTISLPWLNPLFWLASVTFVLITGLLAGSYPALYLSSFQPVKVLKGTFHLGLMAVVPRKMLIVVQFTVSIALIIGTLVVYRQLQFTKNRPVGYAQESLLSINLNTTGKYEVLRSELKKTGVVSEIAESGSSLTGVNSMNKGFHWKGKDELTNDPTFNTITVTPEYGKTVGWKFVGGRDFSRELGNDSASFVINEAAAKLMGFKDPIGQSVKWGTDWRPTKDYTIIGVVKDMVMESPYAPVNPAVFFIGNGGGNIFIKINPKVSASDAITKIGKVVKTLMPDAQFYYQFVDDAYAEKFAAEERVGKLAGFFAALAIFISCLGVFAMALFTAEQRAKEISIRKILGANLFTLWSLLSLDFVKLVVISLIIASPIAYYFMTNWLQNYQYRTGLSLWLFLASGLGAITITLLTVSFQSIRTSLVNPVTSLKSE